MEVCFSDLKEKEIVNIFDGKKLGRIIDILFDASSGVVRGIVVPGDRKLFRKNDDIFVPLERLKKIGDDVILVSLHSSGRTYPYEMPAGKNSPVKYEQAMANSRVYDGYPTRQTKKPQGYVSYVRYKPLSERKYK